MALKFTNIAATTAAVTNRIVTSTDMKVGAYTIANASPVWSGGALITVGVTAGDTADTMGTVVIVGKGLHGEALTETLTPVAGSTVTGTKFFRSVTSATGVDWVVDAVESTADDIVIGVAAGSYVARGGGLLHSVIVNNAVAAAIVISDSAGTILTVPASQAAGSEFLMGPLPWSGFLKVATTSTNDVTVIHTPGVPTSYAMA
jgi:hypothetical protein